MTKHDKKFIENHQNIKIEIQTNILRAGGLGAAVPPRGSIPPCPRFKIFLFDQPIEESFGPLPGWGPADLRKVFFRHGMGTTGNEHVFLDGQGRTVYQR